MGLGSSCLEKVVIPYANSPLTNPIVSVEAATKGNWRHRPFPCRQLSFAAAVNYEHARVQFWRF